jgi:metallo-beta-lactamase family protein
MKLSFLGAAGEEVPVRASICTIGGLSAHADQGELLSWLRNFRRPPRHTYVVHREVEAAEVFRAAIGRELGWDASLPQAHSTVEI